MPAFSWREVADLELAWAVGEIDPLVEHVPWKLGDTFDPVDFHQLSFLFISEEKL